MDENLDEESSQIKDVYAHYGLAMYLAQCLEHSIVNALLYAKLLPREFAKAKTVGPASVSEFEKRFDIFMDEHFRMTMGGLISRLRASAALPTTFDVEITTARNLRNFLAHGFFRERAEDIISKAGRTAMLTELEEAQRLFEQVDNDLSAAVRKLVPDSGLDLTKQEQLVAEYLVTAYARASDRDGAVNQTTEPKT